MNANERERPVVLTIDDEEDIRRLVNRVLEPAGYEVHAASHGEEGLALAAKHDPDLVLLDIKMPGISGLEVLEELKQRDENAAVMMISGQGDTATAVESMTIGASDYLLKPFNTQELLRRVQAALEKRTLVLENESYRSNLEEKVSEQTQHLEQTLTELQRTQQQVIQQERLRALGQMASGVAHDFNNALVPILGLADILLERPETQNDKEKVADYLETIRTAAQDAANVVRRMRAFYRNRDEDEDFMSVSINDLVGQVISLTEVKWKGDSQARSISINIETDLHEIPLVMGSEADLREALTNLILNAIDAMPNGGTITFRTRHSDRHVVLEVSDTGTGMTEDVRQRCLEPFFTSKGERGTGMGLAMVYGIIQRHKGTIDIESEMGKGSNFIIRLPAQAKRKAERGRVKAAATQSRSLRILVVDDELPVLQVVTEYLRGDGHTVETATNGREALEKFIGGGFDLVVTDKAMPEMSGDQLAAAIKTIAPRPVILLTGFGDMMHATGKHPIGVQSIITKPVTLTDLRQAVAKVMAQ